MAMASTQSVTRMGGPSPERPMPIDNPDWEIDFTRRLKIGQTYTAAQLQTELRRLMYGPTDPASGPTVGVTATGVVTITAETKGLRFQRTDGNWTSFAFTWLSRVNWAAFMELWWDVAGGNHYSIGSGDLGDANPHTFQNFHNTGGAGVATLRISDGGTNIYNKAYTGPATGKVLSRIYAEHLSESMKIQVETLSPSSAMGAIHTGGLATGTAVSAAPTKKEIRFIPDRLFLAGDGAWLRYLAFKFFTGGKYS